MGVNDSYLVYRAQVYRLVVAQFLHINLLHLISNSFVLLFLGTRIEYSFGWWKMLVVYLISGLVGDMLSNLLLTSEEYKAGCSPSLFGLLGLCIGYLLINWSSLNCVGFLQKFKLIVIVILLLIFLILFCDVVPNIDWFSHLGGLVSGILLSCMLTPLKDGRRENVMRIVMSLMLVGLVLACFLFFYLMPKGDYSNPR
jgi:rhomboid protease GluP